MAGAIRVLERGERTSGCYNWPQAWTSEWQSSYARLSRFAQANAFGCPELRRLFEVRSEPGRRYGSGVQGDLRLAEGFVVDRIAQCTRSPPDAVLAGFLVPTLRCDLARSAAGLRYCRECLDDGFHAAVYQLRDVEACPVHQCGMYEFCPHCRGLLPYVLGPALFAEAFCCGHCGGYLGIRRDGERPRRSGLGVLEHGAPLARIYRVLGLRDLPGGRWDWEPGEAREAGRSGWVHPSAEGANRLAEILEFLDWVVDRQRGRPAFGDPRGVCYVRNPGGRAIGRPDPRSRRRGRGETQTRTQRTIVLAEEVYRAVRRRIWRHELGDHRACFCEAARHLWWDIEGERMPRICPWAEAYMRWRMYWELVGVPQRLVERATHRPYRIAAWVLGDTPTFPAAWSEAECAWVTGHLLADCALRHYRDLQSAERVWPGRRRWLAADSEPRGEGIWAAGGRDSRDQPLRLWLERWRASWRQPHPGASLPPGERCRWRGELANFAR
jgi:hypothetical protein